MKAWPLILAGIIVIIIIIVVVIYLYYSSIPAVTSVADGTAASVGATPAVANGAPATTDTLQSVADATGTVPVVVTAAGPVDSTAESDFRTAISPKVAGTSGNLANYMFTQGADVENYDIARRADLAGKPAELADACTAQAGCVAFNHEGYLKNRAFATSDLRRYNLTWAAQPTYGVYISNSAQVKDAAVATTPSATPSYTFIQGLDMYGFDLNRVSPTDPASLAAKCDADPKCVGFNSDGYLKTATFDPLYLMQWSVDNASKGFYYKPSKVIAPVVIIFTNTSGSADDTSVTLGVGSAVLSSTAKYIQIPRNVGVKLTKADGSTINVVGFMRANIEAWAGATIVIYALK